MKENFEYLTNAIASFENAHAIYEAKDEINQFNQNNYGLALSSYSLGYIYEAFAEELCRTSRFATHCLEDHEKYLVDDIADSYLKAKKYFQQANESF